MGAPTIDLRGQFWRFVPHPNPDGRLSIIRLAGPHVANEFNYIIIGDSKWQARYKLLKRYDRCEWWAEYAPRTLGEIYATDSLNARPVDKREVVEG
jgi:hypothetical protein